ncbi:MAG: heme exporter protein CcmB [Catalinimonas sp.]
MSLFREIGLLLRKDFLLEYRRRSALSGLLLYVVSTVWVVYLTFLGPPPGRPLWNALFWIILLFAAVNAVAKGFAQEPAGRTLYYYMLARPQAIILAKIIYNTLLMLGLTAVALLGYGLVLGLPVADVPLFVGTVALGAVGFAGTLTLVSAIAARAGNNPTLMAILGFPLMLPTLLLLLRVSKNALDGLDRAVSTDELLTLLAIDAIQITLSYLLFPFLWRG